MKRGVASVQHDRPSTRDSEHSCCCIEAGAGADIDHTSRVGRHVVFATANPCNEQGAGQDGASDDVQASLAIAEDLLTYVVIYE